MFKSILLPTDGSELSQKAVQCGVALAKATGARLVGLHVMPSFQVVAADPMMVTDTREQYERDSKALSEKILLGLQTLAARADVPCRCVSRHHDHPYEAIIEAAADSNCELIVMASHGRRGVKAMVLGSETNKVLTHAKTPVLVVR
jgi:nucleotide-binding universal stress UspA family protein